MIFLVIAKNKTKIPEVFIKCITVRAHIEDY